jgi:hypothetical protein
MMDTQKEPTAERTMSARITRSGSAAFGLLSLCLAFTVTAAGQTSSNATAPAAAQSTQSAQPPAIHLAGLRAVLDKNLDAKKVKQGDSVMAKPEVKLHLADGVDLETSSELLGHVDAVQPSTDKSDSRITVTFDKIKMKDGRQIPVKAIILWIGQPPDLLDPAIVSAPADRTTPGIGVGAGMTGVPPLQGYQGSEIAGKPKRHHDPQPTAPAPTGVFAQKNAIPGVNFTSDIRKPESGLFEANGHNVKVPGGTVFAFAIAVLPPSVPHP